MVLAFAGVMEPACARNLTLERSATAALVLTSAYPETVNPILNVLNVS